MVPLTQNAPLHSERVTAPLMGRDRYHHSYIAELQYADALVPHSRAGDVVPRDMRLRKTNNDHRNGLCSQVERCR